MLNLGASVEWTAYSDVGPLRIGRSRDAIKCYFEHPGSLRAIGWLGPPGVWAPREAGHTWPVAQAGGLDAQEPIAYAGQWESVTRLFLDACLVPPAPGAASPYLRGDAGCALRAWVGMWLARGGLVWLSHRGWVIAVRE